MKIIINFMFFFLFLSFCLKSYSQYEKPFKNRKNAVEVSAYLTNSVNFKLTKSLIPEFGYSRYLGEYVKVGVFYSKFNYESGIKFNNYGARAGFLPLPLIIKNEKFNNLWEAEFSFNYVYNIQKPENNTNPAPTIIRHQVFARLGLSRHIYDNFHVFSNIDIWNKEQIYLGLRYKF